MDKEARKTNLYQHLDTNKVKAVSYANDRPFDQKFISISTINHSRTHLPKAEGSMTSKTSNYDAKPYCWKALSTSVESNHGFFNVSFRALPAELALKDGVHMRFHLVSNQAKTKDPTKGASQKAGSNHLLDQNEGNSKSKPQATETRTKKKFKISQRKILSSSSEELFTWATESKDSSLMIQNIIEFCSVDCLRRIARLVFDNLPVLIEHEFANYLIQKLLTRRDSEVEEAVVSYCKRYFRELAQNEYSSRVMQRLVEKDGKFREFCLNQFRVDLEAFTIGLAPVYLVQSALKNAESESERNIVRNFIKNNADTWNENKFFKKILLSYLETCPEKMLDYYYSKLKVEQNLPAFFKDKYSIFILLKLIGRRPLESREELWTQFRKHLLPILSHNFFGFFVGCILKSEYMKTIGSKILEILLSVEGTTFRLLANESTKYQIYCGAVSMLYQHQHLSNNA